MTLPSHLHFARPCRSLVEPLESRIAPAGVFPAVLSIDRGTPTTETTGAGSVVFKVTFDQAVTGVTVDDFAVFTSVDAKANPVVTLSGTGAVYDVTVSGLRGNGDVRLDLVDNDSIMAPGGPRELLSLGGEAQAAIVNLVPLGGFGLNNGSFTGDAYHLLQVAPKVSSITKVTPSPTEATSVSWTVTFSEAVTGGDAADFTKVVTNTLTAPNALTVTPISPVSGFATSYTVSTTGLTGVGDITLTLVDTDTTTPIKDADGNLLQTAPLGFTSSSTTIGAPAVAVATGDLNGDGKADVVTVNQGQGAAELSVQLGNGDGTFTDKPIGGRFAKFVGVAIADVNGDGKPDLVVAGYTPGTTLNQYTPRNVSVVLGNGDGTFQTQLDYGSGFDTPMAVAVSDMNGDGKQDIVLVASSSGTSVVSVLLGAGNGSFQNPTNTPTGSGASSVAVIDLDGDGDMDVVTGNYSASSVSVLLGTNNGSGGLAANVDYAVGANPAAVAVGDLDGDGRPDIATANTASNPALGVSVLLSDTTPGTFKTAQNFNTGMRFPTGIAIADFNGDGFRDVAAAGDVIFRGIVAEAAIVIPTSGGAVGILAGNGDGTFASPVTFLTGEGIRFTSKLAVADFNGDGKADLAATSIDESSLRILQNTGNGGLEGDVITRAVVAPDLTVTSVTDTKNSAAPGDTLTYTITYKNLTSKGATGVTLRTQLDPNLEFISSENVGWSQSGSALVKVITGTVPGNSADLTETLKLHVKTVISGGYSSIATTTTISDDGTNGTDPDTTNNQRSDFDTLTGLTTDVSVTAIDDPSLAIFGQNGTYTVHLKNTGNASASGQLTVTLPAGVNFSTVANPTWTYDSNAGTIKNGVSVPGGGVDQTVSFTVTFFPKGSTALSTSALYSVFSSPSDSNTGNNQFTEATPLYTGYLVTAPGVAIAKKYAPPVIRVFDRETGVEIKQFFAYEETYRDSIRVAVGDINGDGVDDIITTTSKGTGRLRVFDGLTFQMLSTGVFSTEIAAFTGKRGDAGAFVTVGDFDGNGTNEIAVGNALGGGHVKIFGGPTEQVDGRSDIAAQGTGTPLQPTVLADFYPFGTKFKGGVRVAAGDIDGGGIARGVMANGGSSQSLSQDDLVVGQGFTGGGVKIYKGVKTTMGQTGITTSIGDLIGDFSVGGKGYRGGVSVAVGALNEDGFADLIVGRNSGKAGLVEMFDGSTIGKTISSTGTSTGLLPDQIGQAINPFGVKNKFGVRVAAVDLTGDGIAEIIATVGVKNGSQVKVYDSSPNTDGTFNEVTARHVIPVYPDFPDVALWIAGSRDTGLRRFIINPT